MQYLYELRSCFRVDQLQFLDLFELLWIYELPRLLRKLKLRMDFSLVSRPFFLMTYGLRERLKSPWSSSRSITMLACRGDWTLCEEEDEGLSELDSSWVRLIIFSRHSLLSNNLVSAAGVSPTWFVILRLALLSWSHWIRSGRFLTTALCTAV